MNIIITKDYKEMSLKAAEIVKDQIKIKPNSILGLATGGTPEGLYKLLIEANKSREISFKNIKTFNLDEYIGINKNHKMSYFTFMNEKLFDFIDIDKNNTKVPVGEGNIEKNAKAYDEAIQNAGGIDLQILGIGVNGHIAFNEPGSLETTGTGIVQLTETTITANSRYFESKKDVPKTAITMGIASILKSKKIILIASGKNKAQAISATIDGPITSDVPASFLQKHNNVIIIVDKDAASLLK